ncbi:MAG: carbon storage regulator [Nitrospirae bacterium]|nr:MAG: carbon storage regulator [Nitrospirota bacterium]
MLVLTRRSDEAIRIADDILIKVVEIKGGQVRIGIEAPKGVRIYREELYQRISKENIQSANPDERVFTRLKEVFKRQ